MKLTKSKLKQLIREELAKITSFTDVFDQGLNLEFDEYVNHYGFFMSKRLWACINKIHPGLAQDQIIDKFIEFFDILQEPLAMGRRSLKRSMVGPEVPIDSNLAACLTSADPDWYAKSVRRAGPIRRQS